MNKGSSRMSDQQGNTTDEGRRRLVRAALAAPPLLATFTARPVHAVHCVTNMASGDASNCNGDNRFGGMSPWFWKGPWGGSDVYGDHVQHCWSMAGCD